MLQDKSHTSLPCPDDKNVWFGFYVSYIFFGYLPGWCIVVVPLMASSSPSTSPTTSLGEHRSGGEAGRLIYTQQIVSQDCCR